MEVKAIIEERLSIFSKLYDEMQVFGPMDEGENLEERGNCLVSAPCLKNNACQNCVAIRALVEDTTISKYEEYDGYGINMLATPVEIGNKKYVVELFRRLNENDYKYLGVMEDQVLKKIEELNFELMHDPLTGVYNRRYMEEKLPFLILACKENKIDISIAMSDIDFFKKVNDTYGHQTGDEILKIFSRLVSEKVEDAGGWVARYGGEEFLIVLPKMDKGKAAELIESIRATYEQMEKWDGETLVESTASFGVVSAGEFGEEQMNMDNMVKLADEFLYQAKTHGRNCVII